MRCDPSLGLILSADVVVVGLIALDVLAQELLCMSALRVQIPWHGWSGWLAVGVLTGLSTPLRNHDGKFHGTSVDEWFGTLSRTDDVH